MIVPLEFWCVAALAFALGQSKLFGADFIPLRPLLRRWKWARALVDCSFCLGFWCGLLVQFAQAWAHGKTVPPVLDQAIVFAFGAAAFSYLFDRVTSALDPPR